MPDADPAIVGTRVLAALERGRQRAIEAQRRRGRATRLLVAAELQRDQERGRPPRGRAKRIALATHGLLSERQVARVLDALSSVSDSA